MGRQNIVQHLAQWDCRQAGDARHSGIVRSGQCRSVFGAVHHGNQLHGAVVTKDRAVDEE